MASRIFDNLWVLGKNRVKLTGSFKPNGSSAPTSVKGNGFTVARTGTGVFTVTFQDAYNDFDNIWCMLQCATLGKMAQVTSETILSTPGVPGTLVITTYDAAAIGSGAADLAAASATRVHFGVTMKNTSGNF